MQHPLFFIILNTVGIFDDSTAKSFFTYVFLIFAALFVNAFMEMYSEPLPHYVALVGFPQTGKTTLIVSLFDEILAGKIPSIRAIPRGSKTIDKVNEHLETFKNGRALGPTKDQDIFSFRADIKLKRYILTRTYKVEFGDFPGEDSDEYALKYGPHLHSTEFFKWVVESDAIIFVVDLAPYLTARDEARIAYIAQISSAMRIAWEHFLDSNVHQINSVKKHPLVLAFTKADLFDIDEDIQDGKSFEEEITKLGFGDKTPPVKEINPETLSEGQNRVLEDFDDLIKYYETNAPNFQVLFTSSFGLQNGKRLRFSELLSGVLPRKP